MTQALYRKWRPQTFDQIVGQEHVTQTLRNAITSGRVGHAYLFAGLRGTGKTTMARLLAKGVNCQAKDPADRPCNECAICQAINEGRLLDLIEIDAASHTSVDDVRELRDKIGFRPNACRYKVYIIDEVHRFSPAAFDALLKTIEEPPAHALFVLATTEIHKVPATILSRCQRFDFRRISHQQIVQRLRALVEAEGWQAEPEALALIARSATGSMRDAESLLDQLAATDGGGITLAQVQATLGTIDTELVASLIDSLVARDAAAGLTLVNQALDQGVDLRQFARQIVDHLRSILLIKLEGGALLDMVAGTLATLKAQAERTDASFLVQAIKRFNQAEVELKGGWQPQLPLELALVEVIAGQEEGPGVESTAAVVKSAPVRESPPVYRTPMEAAPKEDRVSSASIPEEPPAPAEDEAGGAGKLSLRDVRARWPQILKEMATRDKSVQALLNSTHPVSVHDGIVTLHVAHEFARAKLSQRRAKRLVTDVLSQIMGQNCRIEYRLAVSSSEDTSPDVTRPTASEGWADDPLVQAAREMGAQVRPIDKGRKE